MYTTLNGLLYHHTRHLWSTLLSYMTLGGPLYHRTLHLVAYSTLEHNTRWAFPFIHYMLAHLPFMTWIHHIRHWWSTLPSSTTPDGTFDPSYAILNGPIYNRTRHLVAYCTFIHDTRWTTYLPFHTRNLVCITCWLTYPSWHGLVNPTDSTDGQSSCPLVD